MVLRSRLKVRVVKELRAKPAAVSNGLGEHLGDHGAMAATLDVELGKQVMQYQVRTLCCQQLGARRCRAASLSLSLPCSGAERGGD